MNQPLHLDEETASGLANVTMAMAPNPASVHLYRQSRWQVIMAAFLLLVAIALFVARGEANLHHAGQVNPWPVFFVKYLTGNALVI